MKNRILYVSLVVIILLSACGLPGKAPGSSSRVSTDLAYLFEIPADPIQVIATLSRTVKEESLISAHGGTISVTGEDGTIFQLDIPAGALASDTLIRMTPVSKIEGMPFGDGTTFAVQLEPEGLQFYDFVTLTITPAQEIPVDQQIFFSYRALGENLALAPPVVDSRQIKILLDHFSGYGVTRGLLADTAPVRQRLGGDAETRIRNAVAEKLGAERQRQLMGAEGSNLGEIMGDAFKQFEEQVLKPRLKAATESCAAGRLALETLLGMERQKQLLGIGDEGSNVFASGLLDLIAEICLKEEYELCKEDHIIHRIIPVWLGMERQFQLLGMANEASKSALTEKGKEYSRKCLTFELVFHSEVFFDDGGDGGYDSTVDSKIKLQFDPDQLKISNNAPLVNTAFEFRAEDCKVTSKRGGGTFEATSLVYIADTKSPSDQLGYVSDFKFIYFPGETSESFTAACEDQPPYTSPPSALWTGVFLPLHEGELNPSEGGFIAEDWEVFGNEYFAKKEWIKEDSDLGIAETGTFKLYHRPGQ